MSDDVTAPAPAPAQGAAAVAVGLWVIVGSALVYGIWETIQKVSALFG
ncbi:hypothetical protein KIH74_22095 [Kineosporia sp. J2-2]|uniref:Uncharacterized protein n=1 Tax=Kineosporia corallincola TaxID=2835133 RepID=A0ABS5TKM0_9ACTN|nr:hypothetical protein [Kineosporia corallincola]MBT0771647.1 hypothetical protein [Kineosporia corallincola]